MKYGYNLKSFGNNIKKDCSVTFLKKGTKQSFVKLKILNSIARGKGGSYGDSSINIKNTILTRNLDSVHFFDKKKGIIKCDSGITISKLLLLIVNSGWFLPVTPGSKKISLGGMIASNIHGKNQHLAGCFHNYVKSISLLYKNNKILNCSKKNNKKIFDFTLGGMGLTGIILTATIKLKKIQSDQIIQTTKVYDNIFKIVDDIKKNKSEYSVSWLDFNNSKSRGVIYYGSHYRKKRKFNYVQRPKYKNFLKSFLLNNLSIIFFNKLYFNLNKIFKNNKSEILNLDKFFYPLDSVDDWNLMYGSKGFFQYQFIIPYKNWKKAYLEIKKKFNKFNVISYLCVMKLMKKEKKTLSFSGDGLNFAIDIRNNKKSVDLMKDLDNVLTKYEGIIYLAKDARLSKKFANRLVRDYSLFKNFRKNNNLKKFFNSLQSDRINL